MPTGTYDAFISYASPDRALAEELHRRLVGEGFNVWFDKARLEPGFDWHQEIEQGCEQSRVLLPVLTPRWLKSDWTRFETYGAESIIPLVYEGPRAEVMTPPLERWQPARLDMEGADEAVWARLFAAIRRCLAEPSPEKTARLDHLHGRPTDFFVGRDAELVRLHEELHRNPRTVLTQGRVRAIAATGGAGKTTLARHFVEKFWRCYPQILWVDCRNGLELEFAELHDLIYPERAHSGLKLPEKAQSALRALNEQTPRLLVLDNAEDEDSTLAWVPKAGGCHTLITSRFSGWSAAVKTLYLFVLDKEPAVTLLQKRSGHPPEGEALDAGEAHACAELAELLGYLPLALEQAAAYVGQQGAQYGFADYLRQYPRTPQKLLARGIRRSDDYPDSVAATWLPTVQRLGPAARAVLRLCAFYAATPIPVALLVRGSAILRQTSARFGGEAEPLGEDEAEFWVREALGDLKAYSLAQYEGRTCSFHTLLQTVERINIPPPDLDGDRAAAVELFLATSGGVEAQDVADLRPLLTHGRSLLSLGGNDDPDLIESVGDLCTAVGDWRDALPLCKNAYELFEKLFGPEHHRTLHSASETALAAHRMGDYALAEPLFRGVLETRQRLLGPAHPDTLTSVNSLAGLLRARGDLGAAEPLYRRALAGYERALGRLHRDTLTSVNNLALLLKTQGDLAAAEPLYRRALAGYERALGPAHPDTLTSVNNLASLLKAQGDLPAAEPLYRRALAGFEQAMGRLHPYTLTSVNNLALLLLAYTDLATAEPLFRRALAGREQALGSAHPDTLKSVVGLARLLQDQGDLAAAEPLFRRALEGRERALGPTHPDTLASLQALADLLDKTDRHDEARPLRLRRIQAITAKSDTLPLELRTAALDAYRLGDYATAGSLLQRVLIQGFEDPGTHVHLARISLVTGDHSAAGSHAAQAWAHRAEAPSYVVPHILWLQLAARLLAGPETTDPGPVPAVLLGRLKTALRAESAHMEWIMDPILERLKPDLPAKDHALLTALVAALSFPDKIADLDVFPTWREAVAPPLD